MKSKINRFVFSVLALQFLVFASCKSYQTKADIIPLPQQDVAIRQEPLEGRDVIEGEVLENPISEWQVSKILVGKNAKVSAIRFINENIGWACNKNFVYKTVDGGKTWESFPIDFVGKAKISSINFTDDLHGWLILQDSEENGYSTEDQIRIYRTTDGGKTWTFSHAEKPALLDGAYFSGNDGWIIATRFLGYSPQRLVPTVIYFSGETSEWTDVSEGIKNLSYDPAYGEDSLPTLESITSIGANCVAIVNNVEKIFQSCDKGNSWKFIRIVGNFHPLDSYRMKHIDVKDDFMWTLQSAGGIEGTSSVLTIMPVNPNEKIKLLSLPNYYINYGFSISSQEFFLAGKEARLGENLADKGLVLQTIDGGKTWKKLFKVTEEIKFVQFLPSSPTNIWVLTSSGTLRKLTKI